jgi:hypothetical protein
MCPEAIVTAGIAVALNVPVAAMLLVLIARELADEFQGSFGLKRVAPAS